MKIGKVMEKSENTVNTIETYFNWDNYYVKFVPNHKAHLEGNAKFNEFKTFHGSYIL